MSTSSNVTDANNGTYPLIDVPHLFMNSYSLEEVLSNGRASAVYSACSLDDVNATIKYAIKIPKIGRKEIKGELEILRHLKSSKELDVSPTLVEEHVDANIPYLVFSLEGPSLEAIADHSLDSKIEKGLLMRLSSHALLALRRLHEMNILHCGISPKSFLLRANRNAKKMRFVLVCGLNGGHLTKDRDGKHVPCDRKFTTDAFTSWPASQGKEYKERDELMAMAHTMLQLGGFYNFANPTEKTRDMRERLYRDCQKTFEECGEPVYYEIFSPIFQLIRGEVIQYTRCFEAIDKHPMYDRTKTYDEIVNEFTD